MTKPDTTEDRVKPIFVVLYPRCGEVSASPRDYRTETFQNKAEAINAVKRTPGARFKICSSLAEAEKQLCIGTPGGEKRFPAETSPAPEISSGYPSVSLAMLSELRKVVESRDVDEFKRLVWSNPKYLIGNGDSPTLLREGNWRRNGLHIAAAAGCPEMVAALLATIRDEKFLRLLYPNDSADDLEFKAAHLVELYLNNREMRRCNTPLHCAVAAGCVTCVELLVAAPECRRFEKNKDDQMPFDLIPPDLDEGKVKRLTQLLGSGLVLCYDTAEGPKLEIRSEAANPRNLDTSSTWVDGGDEGSPRSKANEDIAEDETLKLRAIAGPIPPNLLDKFVLEWKHGGCSEPDCPDSGSGSGVTPHRGPRRSLPGTSLSMSRKRSHPRDSMASTHFDWKDWRLGDYKKGFERIGRRLCQKYAVPWAERWDFLDDFVDICAHDGLKRLEGYLACVRDEMVAIAGTPGEEVYLHVAVDSEEEVPVNGNGVMGCDDDVEEEEEEETPMAASTDVSVSCCSTPPRRRDRGEVKSSRLVLRRLTTSPFERPSNPEPPDLTPISALCVKMAALGLDSPTSGRHSCKKIKFNNNNDDDDDDGAQDEDKDRIPLPVSSPVHRETTLFSLTLSEDVEICEAEGEDQVEEEMDEGRAEEAEEEGSEESFRTAPGTPQDEEWKRWRPSFYIGRDGFSQEDAQVFLALKDGSFWTRKNAECEFPLVHDWFFRVMSKFTLRDIEDRARRGCYRPDVSVVSSPLAPGTPSRVASPVASSSSSSSSSSNRSRPLPSSPLFPDAHVTSSSPSAASVSSPLFAFSPCLALESAFASPLRKARRSSLILQ